MPLTVAKLQRGKPHKFPWTYMNEKLVVTFNPSRWTALVEEEIDVLDKEGAGSAALVKVVGNMVTDIEGLELRKGVPFKMTEDNLKVLPSRFLADLLVAIRNEARPAAEEGKDSGEPSLQAVE